MPMNDCTQALARRGLRAGLIITAAVLAACGGGGVDYPAPSNPNNPNNPPPSADPPQQRAAATAAAIAKAQPLMNAISAAVGAGQKLTEVDRIAQLSALATPGGEISEVKVEHGGTIVMTLRILGQRPPPAWVQNAAPSTALPPDLGADRGQLFWTPYLAAPGVLRWYCFGSYEGVDADTGGACLFPQWYARGVSWGTIQDNSIPILQAPYNVSWVDCAANSPSTLQQSPSGLGGCDPYNGDTHVFRKLPLLCLRKDPSIGAPAGWPVGEPLPDKLISAQAALTQAVLGLQLLGRAPGDALCSQTFGHGWTMAGFEDSGQPDFSFYTGAGMYVQGRVSNQTRYWVRNSIGFSNPWCFALTGLPCES
jgi:hypothetical protein